MTLRAVNLQSEIEYFSEVQPVDQARLLAVFLHELTVEALISEISGASHAGAGPEDRARAS